ncbi:MAG: serine proteinase inhibitor [Hyperionvirus sp.]|uniref:Serine proteinase inhibitor n=1 Tax=Hyperionvirus sp. TaxID=2487770 RepID=A0A3G5ACA8_9VIRU|nr:MAG: serine proteinase inhibitor [Hyperionvirus sp.]
MGVIIIRIMYSRVSRLEQDRELNVTNKIAQPSGKFGEITGEEFNVSEIEYGMPIRSAYSGKKLQMNIDKSKKEGSREPENLMGRNYSMVAGAPDEKVIPELYGLDAGSFLSSYINKFSVNFFTFLKNQLDERFCVSPYGIFNVFGVLYVASKGESEREIYDFFSMISKENVLEGLGHIRQYMAAIQMKNLIAINKDLGINKKFVKEINRIVDVYPVDVNSAESTAGDINVFVDKFSSGMVLPISMGVMERAQVLCINLGVFKPIWKFKFDKIIDSKFIGGAINKVKMLVGLGGWHEYCEDSLNQIVELRCLGDVMSMGIILSKELVIPEIDGDEMNSLLKNLKRTLIEEVRIPVFTQQVKMKLTNVLFQSGLKGVFNRLEIPELVGGGGECIRCGSKYHGCCGKWEWERRRKECWWFEYSIYCGSSIYLLF